MLPTIRTALTCLLLIWSSFAQAQTVYTWMGTSSNFAFDSAANWTPNGPPNAQGAIARFSSTGYGYVQTTGSFTLGTIRIDMAGAPSGISIAGSNAQFTMNNGANAAVVELLSGNDFVSHSISPKLVIAGNNQLDLSAATGRQLDIYGVIEGANSVVTVNRGGQQGLVSLWGSNNFGGTVRVNGGVLYANEGNGLATNSALVLSGGSLQMAGDTIFTRSLGDSAGQVSLTGSSAGFSSLYDALTVRLNNNTNTIAWGTAHFDPTQLVLGADLSTSGASGSINFENGLNLNGQTRTVVTHLLTSGSISISGIISNSTGTAGLRKEGAGTLELTAANTYNGATTIAGGVLRSNSGQGLPTNSNLTLENGIFETVGSVSFTRTLGTGDGQVQFTGSGGFSAFNGPLLIQLNNNTNPLTWGSGSFVPDGDLLRLGSAKSNNLTDFQNSINLNGATRTIEVLGQDIAARSRLSGILSNGSLTIQGGGTLELSAPNTYAGVTTVNNSVLRANSGQGLPATSPLILNNATLESLGTASFTRSLGTTTGSVRLQGNSGFSASGGPLTVQLNNGTSTIVWGATDFIQNGNSLRFGSTKANALVDFRNGLDLADGNRTIHVENNTAFVTDLARISGVISNGSLTKTGPGTLELTGTNTFTGQTTVSEGAIRAVDGLGLPSSSPLRLQGGVLEGSGTFTRSLGTGSGQVSFTSSGGFSASHGTFEVNLGGQSTPAQVTWRQGHFVPNGSELIFGSATSLGMVNFRNPINFDGGINTDGHRAITVVAPTGFNGIGARMSGVISGNDYTLFKYGNGTLELTAANTFFGLILSEGRVLVNNTTGSGTGPGLVEVNDGGTLGGSGRIATVNQTVDFYFGSRLIPGGGYDNSLRIESTGNSGGSFFNGTWVVTVSESGTGGVAAGSGASTVGTLPEPTNHNFLDLDARTQSGQPLPDAYYFTSSSLWEVNGVGVNFELGQRYSYAIGRVGDASMIDGGLLNIVDQDRFFAVGFFATDWSLVSDAAGVIYISFTPVPEPALILGCCAMGLGLSVGCRRWRSLKAKELRLLP